MLSNDGANTEKSGAGSVAQCLRACLAGTRQANVIQSFVQWWGKKRRRQVSVERPGRHCC